MAAIKKQSLVDQIYKKLRKDIITLRYPLGAKLNVSELETQLGVSCTPIREAINRLQQEGLVDYETNIGAHIITLKAHDVEEIQQLALTLHHAAIRLAIAGGSRAPILEGLGQQLEAFRLAKTAEEEVNAVNRFLGVYYHNCGNRRLDKSMLSIQGQQLLLRYLYASRPHPRDPEAELFQNMVDATAQGDTEAVCTYLTAYTARVTQTLKDSLTEE